METKFLTDAIVEFQPMEINADCDNRLIEECIFEAIKHGDGLTQFRRKKLKEQVKILRKGLEKLQGRMIGKPRTTQQNLEVEEERFDAIFEEIDQLLADDKGTLKEIAKQIEDQLGVSYERITIDTTEDADKVGSGRDITEAHPGEDIQTLTYQQDGNWDSDKKKTKA